VATAKINHVALKVSDLDAATKFYENVFGFRQVKTGRSRGHISRHLTDGYVDLAVMVYDSEDDEEAKLVGEGPAIHHFGIEVDDRKSFIEKVKANGGTLLSSPDSGTVKFRSPDGTIAEIVDVGRYQRMRKGRDKLGRLHRRRAQHLRVGSQAQIGLGFRLQCE
jgi:lactoylglutathione lyase